MSASQKSTSPYAKYDRSVNDRKNYGWFIAAGVVGIIAVLAVVAVLLAGGDKEEVGAGTGAEAAENAVQETATVTVQGEDLAAFPADASTMLPDPSTDPAVGQVIPTLTGQTFDGSEIVIGPDDGTPKVILFVAHWCPHCQAEVPLIQDYIEEGRLPDGVEIVTVSTSVGSDQPNYPPSKWLANEGWQPQVLLDDEAKTAAASYGLPGFPYFVMVDADGKVVQRGSGEVPIEEFDAAVQQLAAGSATPTTAAAN